MRKKIPREPNTPNANATQDTQAYNLLKESHVEQKPMNAWTWEWLQDCNWQVQLRLNSKMCAFEMSMLHTKMRTTRLRKDNESHRQGGKLPNLCGFRRARGAWITIKKRQGEEGEPQRVKK
jgi:hypothetical protein